MIIIKLQGGLGNQMFQYAAAKALASKLKAELKLDITTALGESAPERANTIRSYELGQFNIDSELANIDEISRFRIGLVKISEYNLPASTKRKIRKFIERLCCARTEKYYRESSFRFDDRFWLLKDGVYLDGYFQSHKYFENIAELLRREFVVKSQSCKAIKFQSGEGIPRESVSVHVRRGDYVSDEKTNAEHGVCSLDYYKQALEFIAAKVKKPLFYIFSDDLEWCKANFKTVYDCEFVDWCNSPQEEMLLMSKCAHNIIANSSFSWWGAWLNRNPGKIVIAPQKWFAVKKDTSDLLSDGWVKI